MRFFVHSRELPERTTTEPTNVEVRSNVPDESFNAVRARILYKMSLFTRRILRPVSVGPTRWSLSHGASIVRG